MGNCVSDVKGEGDLSTLMEKLEEELSKIVGLGELKVELMKWAKGMLIDEQRRAERPDLGTKKMMPHMVFHGNPGTGKTMVARILGKLLCSVGVLSKDTVVEVQRSDLVGEYVGQTAIKTRAKIEEAMGGVLFVDEAYRLSDEKGASCDYGLEALEEIMSVLEDRNIVVIFAGYTEKMKGVFSANQGFTRRVTRSFHFEDYSCPDLAEMLMIKMTKQNKESRFHGFKLHPSCTLEAVQALIEEKTNENLRSKLNGGLVDHMLDRATEHLNWRLPTGSVGDILFTITMQDLDDGVRMLTKQVKVE